MPPGFGPPPPPPAAAPAPARSLPPTEGNRSGHFVEHLVASTRGSDCCDLAGVPPELLPLKKRVVRYHPYAAAWAIQELSLSSGGGVGYSLRAEEAAMAGRREDQQRRDEEDGGLRAELLRLRISRPALVLTKPLSHSDRSRDKALLVLPEKLVLASPLLGMLTAAESRLVFGPGLPVPAFDRLGRAYGMTLRRDPAARTYLLRGQWTLYLSRHDTRAGDAVKLLAFRPSAWQARLDRHGEGGLGMALLHCPDPDRSSWTWTRRERDAAEGLLLIAAALRRTASSSCRLLTSSANGLELETSSKLLASNSNLVQV